MRLPLLSGSPRVSTGRYRPQQGRERPQGVPLLGLSAWALAAGEHLSLGNFLMANGLVLCLFQLQGSGYRIVKSSCNYRLLNASSRCSTAEGNGVWCAEVQRARVNYSVIMGLCVDY